MVKNSLWQNGPLSKSISYVFFVDLMSKDYLTALSRGGGLRVITVNNAMITNKHALQCPRKEKITRLLRIVRADYVTSMWYSVHNFLRICQ